MKVPSANRQVGLEGLPGVRQDLRVGPDNFLGGTEAAFGRFAAEGLGQVERAAMEVAARQAEEQRQAEREANQARLVDASGQLQQFDVDQQTGANGGMGWNQLQGVRALAPDETGKGLEALVSDARKLRVSQILDSLGNDEQKRLFAQHATESGAGVYGRVASHVTQQQQVYAKGSLLAGIDAESRGISTNYNDSALLQQHLANIDAYSRQLGTLDGSPELGAQQALKHKSEALQSALNLALNHDDQVVALRILHDFAPQMEPDALLMAHRKINQAQQATAAQRIGGQVMQELSPRMQTSDFDRLLNITTGSESGNRHFGADGQPLISAAGAVGIGQVMPGTGPEAAKLAGLPWNPELFRRGQSGDAGKDEEAEKYNKALAGAYFANQLKTFQGDIGQAWAAYNAGPGAVKAAQAKAGPAWLNELPEETQAYVAKNLRAYASGAGRFSRPTLADALAASDAQVRRQFGEQADPDLIKLARQEATAQFSLQEKAVRQREDEGLAEAYRVLQQNGGQFAALPVAVRAGIPADKVDSVLNFARKLAAGEPVKTDWGLYYQLRTDPGLLRKTNLMAFRDRLNEVEFKQLADRQGGAGGGFVAGSHSAGDVLNGFMREAGIEPMPREGDQEGAAKVGRIWSAFEQRLGEAERHKGAALSADEVEKVATHLFTRVGIAGGIFGAGEKPAVLVDSRKDEVKIPEEERRRIIDAWQEIRPGAPITDRDVDFIYLRRVGLL